MYLIYPFFDATFRLEILAFLALGTAVLPSESHERGVLIGRLDSPASRLPKELPQHIGLVPGEGLWTSHPDSTVAA